MKSVGEMLRTEREKKGLTLKQVEKEIKVREKFLRALEEDNWNSFSSKIYITGILKNYSRLLGLDSQKITAFFRRDYERIEEEGFKQPVSSGQLTPQSRRVVGAVIAVLIIFFLFYFAYQIFSFLAPPKVALLSPTTTHFRSVDHITIQGKTEKEASITIFGEKVYPNKDGVFEYSFPLHDGANDLVIEVVGANGKKTVFKQTYIRE